MRDWTFHQISEQFFHECFFHFRRHFRQRTRDLLDRLVRKFGHDVVVSLANSASPDGAVDDITLKRLKNIKKEQAKKQRLREERRQNRGDNDSDDDDDDDDESFKVSFLGSDLTNDCLKLKMESNTTSLISGPL